MDLSDIIGGLDRIAQGVEKAAPMFETGALGPQVAAVALAAANAAAIADGLLQHAQQGIIVFEGGDAATVKAASDKLNAASQALGGAATVAASAPALPAQIPGMLDDAKANTLEAVRVALSGHSAPAEMIGSVVGAVEGAISSEIEKVKSGVAGLVGDLHDLTAGLPGAKSKPK